MSVDMNDSKPSSNFLFQRQANSSQKPQEPMEKNPLTNKFYKLKLCSEFEARFCSKGKRCHYADGTSDLRCDEFFRTNACKDGNNCCYKHISNPRRSDQRNLPPKPSAWKTKMCFFWQKYGNCNNGTECRYAHGSAEIRPVSTGEMSLPSNTSETIMSQHSLGNSQKQEEHSVKTPSKIETLTRKLVGIYGDWINES